MSNSSQSEVHCLDALPKPLAAAYTPAHILNADVLSIIFDIVTKPFGSQATLDFEPGSLNVWATSPTWLLSHVCHSWRQIIFSNPMLWSNVYLHGPSHAYSPFLLQQQLAQAIVSLSININWPVTNAADSKKLIPLFNMLCDKCHLWVDVALKVPGDFIRKLVAKKLSLPRLKRLQLSAVWYYSSTPVVFTAEQAPKLHSFELDLQNLTGGLDLPWEQLKELKLRGSECSIVLNAEGIDRLTSIEVFDVLDCQGRCVNKEKCKALIQAINHPFPSF